MTNMRAFQSFEVRTRGLSYFAGSGHSMIGPPVERAVSANGRYQSNAAPCTLKSSACATSATWCPQRAELAAHQLARLCGRELAEHDA
jgi:hypothetical protein